MKLSHNTPPLLIIRLASKWTSELEEIEHGHFRSGRGWRDDMTEKELADSVRAWWVFSPTRLEERGVRHLAVVVGGRTRALYEIEELIGPRKRDGRWAFSLRKLASGKLFDQVVGNEGREVVFKPGASNPICYWPPSN